MKNIIVFCLITFVIFTNCKNTEEQKEVVQNESESDYELVWSDEFDTDGLPDSSKWNYDYGDGCPNLCGWGNAEKQFFTKNRLENTRLEDGKLIIEARKEDFENSKYTSARMTTAKKGDWKYGRVEVRAKLPTGIGTWPAIWMLSTDWEYGGWPESGEIDIMEHVGHAQDTVLGTMHTKAYNHSIGTHKGESILVEGASTEFHTYGIEWTADKMIWFVDDTEFFQIENEHKTFAEWPFDKRFYLILNISVGGMLGGEKGIDDSIFPQRMEVDYVRIYQKKSSETN